MIKAEQNGALQCLKEIELGNWILGDDDLTGFTNALEKSGCAKQIVYFACRTCEFGAEGVRILADRLRRGAFPALERLFLIACPSIKDVGVVALAEALLEARQTFLTHLVLLDVGMDDEGIAAVASLVSLGRMKEVRELDFGFYGGLTQQGIIAFARAIDAGGLPMLQRFDMEQMGVMTAVGISAITHSLIKGGPNLEQIDLTGSVSDDDRHCDWIAGMFESAGRANEVKVIFESSDDDEEEEED